MFPSKTSLIEEMRTVEHEINNYLSEKLLNAKEDLLSTAH